MNYCIVIDGMKNGWFVKAENSLDAITKWIKYTRKNTTVYDNIDGIKVIHML